MINLRCKTVNKEVIKRNIYGKVKSLGKLLWHNKNDFQTLILVKTKKINSVGRKPEGSTI